MSISRMKAEAAAAELELEKLGVELAGGEPAVEPDVELEPAAKEPDAAPQDNEEMKQLKARFDALEHRLATVQGILKKSESENKSLRAQIEELSVAPKVVTPEPPKIEESEMFGILKTEFGEKSAAAMVELIRSESSTLKKENAELRELLKQTGERTKAIESGYVRTAEDVYFERLASKHSDWEAINGDDDDYTKPQDPRFTAFLRKRVPGTGKTYNDLLNDAYQSLDVARTAEIFDLFKQENKIEAPAKKKDISDLVEPGITEKGTKAPEQKEKKKIYSKEEHNKLMNLLKNGKFVGTREQKQALEDELIDAELEGRIK